VLGTRPGPARERSQPVWNADDPAPAELVRPIGLSPGTAGCFGDHRNRPFGSPRPASRELPQGSDGGNAAEYVQAQFGMIDEGLLQWERGLGPIRAIRQDDPT
jgi:hypothetical protein